MPNAVAAEVVSGTKARIQFSTDGGSSFNNMDKETSMNFTATANGEPIIHKDNPSDHDESKPEGHSHSFSVQGIMGTGDKWEDFLAAALAGTVMDFKMTTGLGNDILITTKGWCNSTGLDLAVRTSGKYNFQMTGTGAPTVTTIASS